MKQSILLITVVMLMACNSIKKVSLFDEPADKPEPPHIENFYALNVMEDGLSSEVWFSGGAKCVNVENSAETKFSGEGSVRVTWDKQAGGCEWIGLGVGWNGWAGKDLSMILNKAALEMKVYAKGKKILSLPLAAAFEDYGGLEAWLGLLPKYITYKEGEEWGTVTLPLSDFDWDQFGADAGNIKQLKIQFEAAGDVYFDDIKIIRFTDKTAKIYETAFAINPSVVMDGILNDKIWNSAGTIDFGGQQIKVLGTEDYLYVAGLVIDGSPLLNNQKGDEIWNGDGFEMALGTNTDANPKRSKLLYSDQHFAVGFSNTAQVWDWKKHSEIPEATVASQKTKEGYSFELKIPWSYFEIDQPELGQAYGFEVAVNKGDGGKRTDQQRWNSPKTDGFHKNPKLWGNIIFNSIQP